MKTLNLVFFISFFLFINNLKAQVCGCTDPLATNYNSLATQNDGSCVYSSGSVAPSSSFNLVSTLSETSGLINWNDQIWTHNDNLDLNIYSLDTANGNISQTYQLTGVINNDWEEISQDSNYIYIGDFGNNSNGNRTNLKVLRIDKNSILINSPVIDSINFTYSDQTDFTATGSNNTDFDCEAFIVSSDSIFLFTKQWISNKTSVYSLSKTPGTYNANLKTTFDVQGLITGAVYLENQRLVVLCGYSSLLQPFVYLIYDFNGSDFFSGNKRKITISLSFHQVEGIATTNGLKYYISNEYFSQPPYITNSQKLHILDLSPYLSNYLNSIISNIPKNEKFNNVLIYPNPAKNQINVKLSITHIGATYYITDKLGKTVTTGKINAENSTIELGNLPEGIYVFSIGEDIKQTFKIIKK